MPRSTPLEWAVAARREAAEAVAWYAYDSTTVADVFLSALDAAMQLLARFPSSGVASEDGSRALLVGGFPYRIHYRERGGVVRILAVAHTSRMPGYWKNRL
jgi:toxin ParE1/3/4